MIIKRISLQKTYRALPKHMLPETKAITHYLWPSTIMMISSGLLWLSYEPENTRARDIYLRYGFAETSEMCGNEIIAVYEL